MIPFALSWWKAGVGILIGAALAFPLGQCSGVKIQKDRAAAAAVKTIERNGKALVAAAEQRGKDAASVAARSEGRLDAVKNLPDETPSHKRCEFNRKRLLDAGAKGVPLCR